MIKVDFHTHTTCSDGILTPSEVVKRAFHNDVEYLAITDHDTISGISEAQVIGKELGVNLIPGIELSTNHNKESIHLLGFFKDQSYINDDFINCLANIKNERIIRAERIVKKLRDIFDIHIDIHNVLKRGKDVVARPHIAQEIIEAGYPYDIDHIFDNFIGKDCKAFVPTNKLTTVEGIKILHDFNALVFLAHPKLIKNTHLTEFLAMDLDGIEAIYFQNTKEEEELYIEAALKNNLLISAGSDCHGDIINDKRHGDIGAMNMPSKYLQAFLHRYNK